MLVGTDESDIIRPLLGNDSIDGGDGFDFVDYSGNDPHMTTYVNLDCGYASYQDSMEHSYQDTIANVEGVIGSQGDDDITGNAQDNWLQGNSGNDTLDGGDGADFLFGGIGQDTLKGGAGMDTFYYTDTNDFGDVIYDFNAQDDMFVFNGESFSDFQTGQLDSSRFADLTNGYGQENTNVQDSACFVKMQDGLYFDPDGLAGGQNMILIANCDTYNLDYHDIYVVGDAPDLMGGWGDSACLDQGGDPPDICQTMESA